MLTPILFCDCDGKTIVCVMQYNIVQLLALATVDSTIVMNDLHILIIF